MNLEALAVAAKAAIEARTKLREEHPGLFGSPAPITLVLKRDEPRGNRVLLAGRFGPLGEFLASPRDGEVLAVFDAAEVLRWVHKIKERLA